MLGYMLALPAQGVIDVIDSRIRKDYGEPAALQPEPTHPRSLAVVVGALVQSGNHQIRLKACLRRYAPSCAVGDGRQGAKPNENLLASSVLPVPFPRIDRVLHIGKGCHVFDWSGHGHFEGKALAQRGAVATAKIRA